MLICYLGYDQVYVDTFRKNKKEEEVDLLFLKVVLLFVNSNKRERHVVPTLSHSDTHNIYVCRVIFVDPVQGSIFAG